MEQSRRNLEIGCSNLISINHRLGGHLPFSWWFMLTSIQSDVTLVVDAFQSSCCLASFTVNVILSLKGSCMKFKKFASSVTALLVFSCLGLVGCGSDEASSNTTSDIVESSNAENSDKSNDAKNVNADESDDSIDIYENLAGVYKSPAGVSPQFEEFTISDVDSELGEFEITFTQSEIKSQGAAESIYAPASVEAVASVSSRKGSTGEGAMDDGYIYEFEATGTSDQGSETATLKGYISVNESGKPIVYIKESKISTTFTSSTDRANGWDGKNDIYTVKDMTLTKQS